MEISICKECRKPYVPRYTHQRRCARCREITKKHTVQSKLDRSGVTDILILDPFKASSITNKQ